MPINKKQAQKLKALGEKVKSEREKKGLTLRDLGNIVDKEPTSIHRLEKGRINPTFLYLLEICRGLEIDLAVLMKGFSE